MISIVLLYIPCKAALSLVHRLKLNARFKSAWGEMRREKRNPEAAGLYLDELNTG